MEQDNIINFKDWLARKAVKHQNNQPKAMKYYQKWLEVDRRTKFILGVMKKISDEKQKGS